MIQLQELYRYRDMLKYLVRTDLRVRYKGSVLGFLWTFVNPLIMIIIYSVVFSTILKVNIPNYTVYLISGLLPWTMFQTTVVGSSSVIIRNSNLVKKVYFPRHVLPLSVVLSNAANYLYSMVIVLAVVFIFHSPVGWSLLLFPAVLFIEVLLMTGLALIFSAVNVYFRDVEHLLTVFMMAWFYITPVVYSLKIVPSAVRPWFYINPMTPVIESYVDILYYGIWPSGYGLLISVGWAVISLVGGWLIFNRLNPGFGEEV